MKILSGFVLLWLCCALTANAQLAAPPKPVQTTTSTEDISHLWDDELYRWWWGYTTTQVYDKLLSEPGWKVNGPEEDGDPELKIMSAQYTRITSSADIVNLFFSFAKNTLIKRAYSFSTRNPLVSQWNALLTTLPYDERNSYWIDAKHHASIKRRYIDEYIMFEVEVYFPSKSQK